MLLSVSGAGPSKYMLVKLVQSENAKAPMLSTLAGIVMLVKLEQFTKAKTPIKLRNTGVYVCGIVMT